MLNWRKPVINTLLKVTGSTVPAKVDFIKSIEYLPREQIELIQKKNLKKLLLHAGKNCPYYTKVLSESGVIQNDQVRLDNFNQIPFLTKDIIRKEFNNIVSKKTVAKKTWTDTSGGSTGVPVKLLKDNFFWDMGIASHIFYNHMIGKKIGEKEIKLWGSERDTLTGKETLSFRLKNWLYNRKLLNSFRMTDSDMHKFVEAFNTIKPKSVWCYIESIYELARFVKTNSLTAHPPEAIIATAGTITEPVKQLVEEVFQTKVYNQYGSREVGCVAAECVKQEGLHIFEFSQMLEVIDENNQEVQPGVVGENVITTLYNHSFPLIRYRIGDTSIKKDGWCSCGRKLKLLKTVTGRVSDHFKSQDGAIIHGEYFTHLFYDRPWIKKFQVVQNDYNNIDVYIVQSDQKNDADIKDIKDKIRHVLGNQCITNFKFVNEILASDSGKYRYTISKLSHEK
ncbi:phenylacetate--CoA ligase family protein [Patescibacteria group bacterium]|nr:phenylacetate--CoA ligase family protein [Patescibacteria group bacterium]MBU1889963.1 phenylacetate--CoA ligase family protein [Patescibacteria group bacterium]